MPATTTRCIAVASFAILISVAWLMAGEEAPEKPVEYKMAFRAVETKDGPMVTVSIANVFFLTPSLKFQHDSKEETLVQAKGDKVELRSGGETTITAKSMEFSLGQSGPLTWGPLPQSHSLKVIGASLGESADDPPALKKPKFKFFGR